jgi:NAD(P)-dependent dehydrogenase (short-subunit alcohol dehydrogenase family)
MSSPRRDPYSPTLLEGDRVLVTGGGSGLGRAIAGALVAHGAEVVLWGRRAGILAEAAAEIGAHGNPSRVVVDSVDVRDAEAVDAAVARIFGNGRPLTAVVNGAAANFIAPTESLSARAFAAVTSTVINGSFHVTHAVGKRWIADGLPGSVLSLLTTWVETGSAYVVPSAMSKAAVNAMTMSLAVEWAHYGIRLNAVAPGPVPTDFAWDVLDPGDPSVIGATDVRGIPAGRFGRPDEVANLVMFLLSDACDYLTGETIAMDGGQRLAGPSTFSDLTHLTADDWAAIRARGKAAAATTKAQQGGGVPTELR